MIATTTIHATDKTRATADFFEVPGQRRYIAMRIGDEYGSRVDIICGPEFLDKLANECERAVREFVGDVPGWCPPHANGEYCECGECKPGADEVPA